MTCPFHPLFYLTFSFLTGVGLIIFYLVAFEIDKKYAKKTATIFLYSGWLGAAIFAICLGLLLRENTNETFKLAEALAPLGILLSALIASASVMKSIESNKEQHNEKQLYIKQVELEYFHIGLFKVSQHFQILSLSITADTIYKYSKEDIQWVIDDVSNFINKMDQKELIFHLKSEEKLKLVYLISSLKSFIKILSKYDGSSTSINKYKDRLEQHLYGDKGIFKLSDSLIASIMKQTSLDLAHSTTINFNHDDWM